MYPWIAVNLESKNINMTLKSISMNSDIKVFDSITEVISSDSFLISTFRIFNMDNSVLKPPFIIKLNLILNTCYSDDCFNVKELSHKLHLCEMQVNRKIKKHSGLSAGKYIMFFRIFRAIELLLLTDSSIKEISFNVGYNNPSNFSQTFRRVIGYKPSEIRELFFLSR